MIGSRCIGAALRGHWSLFIGRLIVLVGLLLIAAGSAQAAGPKALDPVKARLVADAPALTPGGTLWVDLHVDIAAGWHIYWRNPGDSGLPTQIEWTLPPGFAAGDINWPAPERFVVGTIGNYGYAGSADLLVPISVPATPESGAPPPRIDATASWLVCSEICIPGEAKLTLDLPVGTAAAPVDPAVATMFAQARSHLPQAAPFAIGMAVAEHELRLFLPAAALAGVVRPTAAFFSTEANIVDAGATPRQKPHNGGLELIMPRLAGPAAGKPATLDGVLTLHGADGAARAYSIAATPVAAVAFDDASAIAAWQALLLAFLGGLVLNLMPCVFPVLSLKLLGLATSIHRAERYREGGAYAAGVVLSFAVLGSVLLILRSGGAAVGWGFQLQSPVVVGLLAYLLFAMGLSLSGVADFGAGLAGFGDRFAGRGGLAGAFATGVLATVVATPCTAPFMGAALGFALVAPTPVALAIFVALGCGLAAPLALASAIPGIARLLPRPGAWMVWFKQILAFPLYATVAWLVWVLIQEIDAGSAFAALLGLVAVGFAVWIYGRTRFAATRGRHVGSGLAAAGLATAIGLAALLQPSVAPSNSAGTKDALGYQPFSTARLAALTTEHQPVFVNLTAAWCITCLVNERATLDSAAIRRAFADRRVVTLKGDWTRQDPDITAFLQRFGRSGVPLYLLYGADGEPTVLPQILTEANVLSALGKI
ncbi:MAG TPA: protein-disulfide reductase DsbD domain-containing protein [Stellaceae bacterium]|jgi:thiol:disulfide interchange protein DsbD|nr:protein-disulfide reductase DsbD domain-containing protein [Stellaceae bacterium]